MKESRISSHLPEVTGVSDLVSVKMTLRSATAGRDPRAAIPAPSCRGPQIVLFFPYGSEVPKHGVYIYGFYARKRNHGLGNELCIVVLGPLGFGKVWGICGGRGTVGEGVLILVLAPGSRLRDFPAQRGA